VNAGANRLRASFQGSKAMVASAFGQTKKMGSDSQSLYLQDKTEEQQSDACHGAPRCLSDIQLHPTFEDRSRQQLIHWNSTSIMQHC